MTLDPRLDATLDVENTPRPTAANEHADDVAVALANLNPIFITHNYGTYKPYDDYFEAWWNLLKHPSEFSSDYSEHSGVYARLADALRIRMAIDKACVVLVCDTLKEDNGG